MGPGIQTPGDMSGGGSGGGGRNGSVVDSPPDDGVGFPDGLGGPHRNGGGETRACDECRRKKIKCDGKQVRRPLSAYGVIITNGSPVRIVPYTHIVFSRFE